MSSPNPYIGEIRLFAFTFIPSGWLSCNGSLQLITAYPALFSFIGITYGGNGSSNFALPDLRGTVAIGVGTGSGLSPRTLGQTGGEESHTLTIAEIPSHNHTYGVNSNDSNATDPLNNFIGRTSSSSYQTVSTETNNSGATGGSGPHNNMQPFLVLNYCIATSGTSPI